MLNFKIILEYRFLLSSSVLLFCLSNLFLDIKQLKPVNKIKNWNFSSKLLKNHFPLTSYVSSNHFSLTSFVSSNHFPLTSIVLSNIFSLTTSTRNWNKKVILKPKTAFFSPGTMFIVFLSLFYIIYVKKILRDTIPLM